MSSNARCLKITEKSHFWKLKADGQTVLPDMSILKEQKLVENAKIENLEWDILGNFQTLWVEG